jgi:translation elongation factor EF-Tu-like GTPase
MPLNILFSSMFLFLARVCRTRAAKASSKAIGHSSAELRPVCVFRTIVTGEVPLPEGIGMVLPGDNTSVAVRLDKPVGSRVITEVIE